MMKMYLLTIILVILIAIFCIFFLEVCCYINNEPIGILYKLGFRKTHNVPSIPLSTNFDNHQIYGNTFDTDMGISIFSEK